MEIEWTEQTPKPVQRHKSECVGDDSQTNSPPDCLFLCHSCF